MYNAQSFKAWRLRWQAYKGGESGPPGALDSLVEKITVMPKEIIAGDRQATLKILTESLQSFGKRQMDFFLNGFDDKAHPKKFILEPSADYPVDYALNVTLLQVSFDLAILKLATENRLAADDNIRNALKTADLLAQKAVDPALTEAELLQGETAVLTYMNKSANSRLLPYAPISLVGVPNSITTLNRDYLAIPHEVGHYIYRHGMYAGKRIAAWMQQASTQQPPWLQRWLEEIFADVYGCLIAGPVIARDFQDLLLDNSLANFLVDDGHHPISALRPAIYTQLLQEMGFTNEASTLNDRWEKWLAERGNPATFVPYPGDSNSVSVPMEVAAALVAELVSTLLHGSLKPLLEKRQANKELCWSQTAAYANFKPEKLINGVTLAELKEADGLVWASKGADVNPQKRIKGSTGQAIDLLTTPGSAPVRFSAEMWTAVLAAGGWATKGPEGGHVGPG